MSFRAKAPATELGREEAVVAAQARVVEEVVVHKGRPVQGGYIPAEWTDAAPKAPSGGSGVKPEKD